MSRSKFDGSYCYKKQRGLKLSEICIVGSTNNNIHINDHVIPTNESLSKAVRDSFITENLSYWTHDCKIYDKTKKCPGQRRKTSLPSVSDIICVTESWLRDDVYSAELFNCNISNVFIQDRDYQLTELAEFVLRIYCINVPSYVGVENLSSPLESVSGLGQKDHSMILGDYNVTYLCWKFENDESCYIAEKITDQRGEILVASSDLLNLRQFNGIKNINDKGLDLSFSSLKYVNVAGTDKTSVPEDSNHPFPENIESLNTPNPSTKLLSAT
ncbi:hypothetical protein JTB14_017966 [Gonioctena quinquepunctata]|nr:hypothetical protein JTB14_017966 [Gonioctena quinquepunctata]